MNELELEVSSKDRLTTTLLVKGLSVDEMHQILDVNHNLLKDIMAKHGMADTYNYWKNGCGIYSIKHFGAYLLVQIGNNVD